MALKKRRLHERASLWQLCRIRSHHSRCFLSLIFHVQQQMVGVNFFPFLAIFLVRFFFTFVTKGFFLYPFSVSLLILTIFFLHFSFLQFTHTHTSCVRFIYVYSAVRAATVQSNQPAYIYTFHLKHRFNKDNVMCLTTQV